MIASPAAVSPEAADLPRCCACGDRRWRPCPPTRLYRCGGCGTVFNARSRTREEEEALYDTYSEAPPSGDDRVAAAQWGWVRGLSGPETGSVLDVGCGYGAFLRQARVAGWRALGVELDPRGAAACVEQGLDVRRGSLFDVDLPTGPFHLVTLWDVLEHLEDPAAALDILVPRLAPGGLLVVRGRNAALHAPLKVLYGRLRPLFKAVGVPDLSCVHRWGFGQSAYRRLLESRGLAEIRGYPGVPTPGDRFSAFRGRALAAAVKGAVRAATVALYRGTGNRVYLFPSVLIVGRKGQS